MAGTFSYNTYGIAQTNNCTHIFKATDGGTTFSSNLVGTNFSFFDVGAAANDAIYFCSNVWGHSSATLELDIDTAISGTGLNIVWEYHTTSNYGWLNLADVAPLYDETNTLTTTGQHKVRFGRPPFYQANGITIASTTIYWVIRARLVSGTMTNGGIASTNIIPRFYDGTIRPSGWAENDPFTLKDVYEWVRANVPEIVFTKAPDYDAIGFGHGELYNLENSHIYGAGGAETTWKMSNCTLAIGNGSLLYQPIIGDYFTDGYRVGNFGYTGSVIIINFFSYGGTSWAGIHTKFYGTTIKAGYYQRVINGTTYQQNGFTYLNMTSGEYIGCVWDGISNGYMYGSAEVRNSYLRSGFYPFYTLPAAYTFDNNYLYFHEVKPTGILGLYGDPGYGDDGYFKNLKWFMPTGSCLFHPGWNVPNTWSECHYRFLNPDPILPRTYDSTGGVGLMYVVGYGENSSIDNPWHINEYFELDITILDEQGASIPSTVIQVYDKNNTLVHTAVTDGNGQIDTYNLMTMDAYFDQVNNVPTLIDFNPFTIVIDHPSYNGYQTRFNVTTKTFLPVTLTAVTIVPEPFLPLPEGYTGELTGPLAPTGGDNPLGGDDMFIGGGLDSDQANLLKDDIYNTYINEKYVNVPKITVDGQTVTKQIISMKLSEALNQGLVDQSALTDLRQLSDTIADTVIEHIKTYAETEGSTNEIVNLKDNVVTVNNNLSTFYGAINAWVPIAMDGGAALKTILTANLATLSTELGNNAADMESTFIYETMEKNIK